MNDELGVNTYSFFHQFGHGKQYISSFEIRAFLNKHGFLKDDSRWSQCYEDLISLDKFDELSFDSVFKYRMSDLKKALNMELIIPRFQEFTEELTKIFEESKMNKSGNLASYIPQLARVDPEKFGVSICTIDAQRFHLGDYADDFCAQSCSKPITYGIALETLGEEYVHKFVDKEPSGQNFSSLILIPDKNIPYNPMVNAGAIMICSLIEKESDPSERYEKVISWWKRLAGGFKPGFNNSVYLSELYTADKNFSLAYIMKSKGGFSEERDVDEILEFYFQCCSVEVNCNKMAMIAATLANGGVCPTTHERVFSTATTRAILSLMFSCGMYDYSGQFAFNVGIPAKSGVSGCIMVVIPGTCGICLWSPRLDKYGNSVRGLEFLKLLVNRFSFHNFDNLVNNSDNQNKIDPVRNHKTTKEGIVTAFFYACLENDTTTVRRMILSGMDVNTKDYDKRTGLHIAASEGHEVLISFLVEHGANINARDRWNNTPIDDARRHNKTEIIYLLESHSKRVSLDINPNDINKK